MSQAKDQRWIKGSDVIERIIDGEAVILDMKTGVYYSLDTVGTEIWNLLDNGATETELIDKIVTVLQMK